MNLYFVRHAPAEAQTDLLYPDDSLRPLSKSGRKKMAGIAQGVKALGIKPNVILTSPFARAFQTAEILQKTLNLKNKQMAFCEHLAPGGNMDALITEINETYRVPNVLLVGHEPDMSELISMLILGSTSTAVTLKKGGMCCLAVADLSLSICATLEWLLTPAMLIALKKIHTSKKA